jgi:hypothetical protein
MLRQSQLATGLFAQLAARYPSGDPAQGIFSFVSNVQIVAAAGHTLSFYELAQPERQLRQQQLPVTELQSMHVAHTPAGSLIACVSGDGRFCVGRAGEEMAVTAVTPAKLWHVTACVWRQRLFFLVCATDQRMYVLDSQGQTVAHFVTPGRILSLAVWPQGEEVFLVGGVQDKPQVYVWALSRILAQRDAAPIARLRGGGKPAYAALFAPLDGQTWLLHSCWDGWVYGCRWLLAAGAFDHPSQPLFPAQDAVYGLATMGVNGRAHLLAGTESGLVMAWPLDAAAQQQPPAVTLTGSGRVRWLTAATVAGQPILLAGSKNGMLHLWAWRNAATPDPPTTIPIGDDEVNGIGVLPVARGGL